MMDLMVDLMVGSKGLEKPLEVKCIDGAVLNLSLGAFALVPTYSL